MNEAIRVRLRRLYARDHAAHALFKSLAGRQRVRLKKKVQPLFSELSGLDPRVRDEDVRQLLQALSRLKIAGAPAVHCPDDGYVRFSRPFVEHARAALRAGPPRKKRVQAAQPATAHELLVALRKNGLIGMWRDRTDIGDTEEFARQLREQASKRRNE